MELTEDRGDSEQLVNPLARKFGWDIEELNFSKSSDSVGLTSMRSHISGMDHRVRACSCAHMNLHSHNHRDRIAAGAQKSW